MSKISICLILVLEFVYLFTVMYYDFYELKWYVNEIKTAFK